MPVEPTPAQRRYLWIALFVILATGAVWWAAEAGLLGDGTIAGWLASQRRGPLLSFEPATGLYLLYTMPIGAAVVVFARMVIGMQSFGLFTPMLMAMAFLQTGPVAGPIIVALAIGSGLLVAPLLKGLKMARVGFLAGLMAMITIVLIALLPTLESARWVTAFPVVVTALAVERWWVVWEGEGLWDAFKIAFSTMVIAIAIELVVLSPPVAALVEFSPYLAAALGGAVSLACGLYRGLRLAEVMRFKAVRG